MTAFPSFLAELLASGFRDLAVASPGRVLSYDSTTGVAVVRPGVQKRVPPKAQGGEDTYETLPEVRAPVCWPGGGSFGAHAPLAAGDKVLLVFCDADASVFFRTGEVSRPADTREHHPSHAVAIPLVRVVPPPGPGPAQEAMTIGHADTPVRLTATRVEVDGSTDAAALASKLDQIGQVIGAMMDPINPAQTMAAVVAILNAFRAVYPLGVGTAASSKLKLGG